MEENTKHPVPENDYQVVLIRDRHHTGTEIYRVSYGLNPPAYRFVSLDFNTVDTTPRCVLLKLNYDFDSSHLLPEPFGLCEEPGFRFALIGVDMEDSLDLLKGAGEVVWDSADEDSKHPAYKVFP